MNENRWILHKNNEVKDVPTDGKIEIVPETVHDYKAELLEIIRKIKAHPEPPNVDDDAYNTRHPWDKFGGVSSGICQGWFWFKDEVILSKITLGDALLALEEFGESREASHVKRYFTVSIKETLEKTVVVAAEDAAHAEEIAEELCNSEEIVLEYDHFSGRTTETLRVSDCADIDRYGVYNQDETDANYTRETLKDIVDGMMESNEDRRNSEMDDNTGFYYIAFND